MSAAEHEVLKATDGGIAAYSEFRAQLATLRAENSALVFDYADPKGNKEARSHIHKLRRTKGAVDAARKTEKAASLEYGRKVDAEAKEIIGEIESMIEVHERPILEIEAREEARKTAILNRLGAICRFIEVQAGLSANTYRDALDELNELPVDESLDESMAAAVKHKKDATAHLTALLADAEKREAEAAELARLRAEAAAREQAEREARIAEEAAAKAKAEAEAAVERGRLQAEAAAKREQEAAAARERAERERAERAEAEAKAAQERAAKAAQEAVERERREQAAKAKAEEAERERREADKTHRAGINNGAAAALVEHARLTEAQAKTVVEVIARGRVPAVTISY